MNGEVTEDLSINAGGGVSASTHHSQLYNWKDVTSTFLDSCTQLNLGELVHDDVFRLFEAMSAIEIMDPKMDSGINTNLTPLTFETAAQSGHLPLTDITPEQFIGIIDESMTGLVVWLEGHSLVQTVFTNLYTHKPEQVQNSAMQGFTFAYLKIVEVIRKIILEAGVYEEEDHQPTIYGFKLPGDKFNNLNQKVKAIEDTFPESGANKSQHKAINQRLKFLRQFYLGLQCIDKGEMTEGFRILGQARELLDGMISTVNLGVKPAPGQNMLGFDPTTNQRLLPPTFPRYTQMKDRGDSYQYIKTMINEILNIADISHAQGFGGALAFYETFSSSGPVLLSRSILHLFYTPQAMSLGSSMAMANPGSSDATRKTGNLQDLLQESCREFHLPPAILELQGGKVLQVQLANMAGNVNVQQVRQCLDMFFFQCCKPFGLLLQSYGHNRARQREKLALVLEEFFTPQEEADKIDKMLNTLAAHMEGDAYDQQSLYLSSWLIYHVIKIMIKYILSGFELELFAVHEYTYIFFYLHDLLYPWLINCLHRANISRKEVAPKKKEKSKSKQKSAAAKNESKHQQFALEMAVNQAKSILCGGLLKFMIAARKQNKIQIPNQKFDNEEVRYRHRFDAFSGLFTPPMAPYEQYKEVVNLTEEISAKDLYLMASKDFSQSRHILESLIQNIDVEPDLRLEVGDMITLLKTNFVVASILAKDLQDRALQFEFTLHPHFPVVKLV